VEILKDIYHLDNPILDDAFDRTVVNLYLEKRANGAQVFMICGCEPGTGATTVSINLAVAMAAAGWQTLLIDADLRKENRFKRLGQTKKTLSEYLGGSPCDTCDIVMNTNHPGLSYVSGGASGTNPISLLGSPKMDAFLCGMKAQYDFIMIDTPSPQAAADAYILGGMSDQIILVAAWNHTATEQLRQTKKNLEEIGASILGVIVNRIEPESYNHIKRNHKYFIDKKYQIHATPIQANDVKKETADAL